MKSISKSVFLFALAAPILAGCGGGSNGPSLSVSVLEDDPEVKFALEEITKKVEAKKGKVSDSGEYKINLSKIDASLGEESYKIEVNGKSIEVTAGDPTGLMYAGLSIAESIEDGGIESVKNETVKPDMASRGLKFNIPLDMRTPSYTDGGDSGQSNIPTVWDETFWKEEFDRMAINRMNVLTLWNLNPFPSMVKVPGYEDCALDDVWRTTLYFDDSYKGTGADLVREEHWKEGNYEVVKQIKIDEKIEYWKKIFAMAHDRGIKTYYYFWNVYTFGEHNHYGITPDQDNETTKDYFRKAVEAFVDTYQDLDGIGIAAGENMKLPSSSGETGGSMGSVGYGDEENEQWLHDTYGDGVKASLGKTPNRKFEFIHRMHYSDAKSLKTVWGDLPCTFSLSDKYSTAHMYAVEEPHLIDPTLETMEKGQHLFLEMRNDDAYFLRYGGVDFLRAYITKIPDAVTGYFMGSDGYIQGREYTDTDPATKGQLFMAKHWYNYMLLGRIAYQHNISDEFFQKRIKAHFSDMNLTDEEVKDVFDLLNNAGRILPKSNILFYTGGDSWYPEASWTNPNTFGYIGVKRLIKADNPHPYGNTYSIPEYSKALKNGETLTKKTPVDVINDFRDAASKVDALAEKLKGKLGLNSEFDKLYKDQVAWSNLGKYYADKYEGVLALRLWNDNENQDGKKAEAVELFTKALPHWEAYAEYMKGAYADNIRLSRAGIFSFSAVTEGAKADISDAQAWKRRNLN